MVNQINMGDLSGDIFNRKNIRYKIGCFFKDYLQTQKYVVPL